MLYFIGAIGIAFVAIISYSLYKSRTGDLEKMISLPVLILLVALSGWYYVDQLGKPIEAEPVGKWDYVHHVTNGETIELWVRIDDESRLYLFPYSEETRKKLEEAQKAAEQGVPIEGEFTKSPRTGNQETPPDSLTIRFKVEAGPKKN